MSNLIGQRDHVILKIFHELNTMNERKTIQVWFWCTLKWQFILQMAILYLHLPLHLNFHMCEMQRLCQ